MKITKILIKLSLCSLLIIGISLPVLAKEAYHSYLYDAQSNAVYAPDAVAFNGIIDYSTLSAELKKISDITCGPDGRLYILDGELGRIYICDVAGKLLETVETFMLDGKTEHFSNPSGFFVTKDSSLYVADTGNARIVELDGSGKGVRAIYEPPSTLLGAEYGFKPIKLAIDDVGQIYVVSQNYTNGLIVLDMNGEYLRSIGVPRVTFNIAEYIWKTISTKEQLDRMKKFIPTEFNNVSIDEEGFLYVTCSAYSVWDYLSGNINPLKKLNATGNDILRSSSLGILPYGDLKPVSSGEFAGGSVLVDSLPMENGVFAILDANRGKVMVYNGNYDLLFNFGAVGNVLGVFQKPVAIAWGNGRFYVADGEKQCISLFEPNEYGRQLLYASQLNAEGRYDEEEELWRNILSQNSNNTIALIGLGRTAYENGDYIKSMEYFRKLGDTANYSKAFYIVRRDYIQANPWILAVFVALMALIAAAAYLLKIRLRNARIVKNALAGQILYSKKIIFRPMSGFWNLTRESQGSFKAGMFILGAGTVVMFLNTYAKGFIFGAGAQRTPLLIPLLQIPLIVFVLSLCNWCIGSLLDGKGTLKNIVTTYCYALTPIVILFPAAVVLSNILTAGEGDIIRLLISLAIFWSVLLIIVGNKQVHDYSLSKSIFVLILTVLLAVIMLFLLILFMILVQQMAFFGRDIAQDILSLSTR